jgi:hypothetical protein
LDLLLVHVDELLRLANARGVYDDLTSVLPPDFTTHVFPPIEQMEDNELLPVHDGAQLLFRVGRMLQC